MDKWIILTFWTKPMGQKYIESNLETARISLYYAHRSGYRVRMHTDSIGYKHLKDIGYDDLLTTLDEIPENIPGKIFAYPKYIALKHEPIGMLHTDFDVFIKKPCIDVFYEHPEKMDIMLQGVEGTDIVNGDINYANGRRFFNRQDAPAPFLSILSTYRHASNVGIIGFTNPDLREMYLYNYEKYVNYFLDEIIEKDDKFLFIPDLFFEQIHIDYLIFMYKFRCYYILPGGTEYLAHAKKIGYQHAMGAWKYTEEGHKYIHEFCDRMYTYKTSAILLNWISPNCEIDNLCNNNKLFINFDKIICEYIQQDSDETIEKIFKIFNNVCKLYDGQNKVLITSNIHLLHAFYHDFSNIYVNNELLDESIKKEIDFVKERVYVTYISDDISNYANELT